MKIAVFSDNFYPEISGISDSIILLAKELAKMGHETMFYVPKYSKKDYDKLKVGLREMRIHDKVGITRMRSIAVSTGTGQGRAVIPSGLHFNKIRRFNPHIIHVHLPFGAGIEGLLYSKLLQVPLVGTNHTPMAEFADYARFNKRLTKKMLLKYDAWFYNNCDFVSSPSQAVFKELDKYKFHKPHKVISNPITLPVVKLSEAEKERVKNKYKLSGFVILYSGRLAKEKHIDVILRAMVKVRKRVPDVHLVITGTGRESEKLKRLAKILGLNDSVSFLGFLPENELSKIYCVSDIFVIMSIAETQCMAAMKAGLYSKPIIAADFNGLKDYVSDTNGFLVEPRNVDALAEKIICLCIDSKLRTKKGKNAKKIVEEFAPERIAKIWYDIYAELIKDKNLK